MSRALGKTKKGQQYQEQFYKRLIEIFDGDEQKVKDCMGVKLEEINDAWFEEHKIAKKKRLGFEADLKFDEACDAIENGEWEKAENLYKDTLLNYDKPERAWHNLGNVLKTLGRYEEAGEAYRNSLKINPQHSYPWIGLGNILFDYFANYEEAKRAFLKAIEIDKVSIYPKANLVFLYRDKLNDISEALKLFEETKDGYLIENVQASAYLHEAIFALYNKNWGTSADFWKQALNQIEDKIPRRTQDDWQRSVAIAVKFGFRRNRSFSYF
jgi:tetratricopeptide (TPR) repeat protein